MQITSTLNVLLIEDNPGDALLVQEMLNEINEFAAQLHHMTTLAQAIRFLEAQTPDVILLDLDLPDSDGIKSVNILHGIDDDIPIVILTGNTNPETAFQALDLGAQDYLRKGDIHPTTLNLAIRYAIERHRYTRMLLENTRQNFALQLQVESLQFLRDLVASIQHEFRNPLTVIHSAIDLIQERQTPEAIQRNGGQIKNAVSRLVEIGDYMAAITELAAVNVDQMTPLPSNRVQSLCHSLISNKPQVVLNIAPSFEICMGESDFMTMMESLLLYALDQSLPNKPIELNIHQVAQHIHITISSYATPIPEEESQRLFLPFQGRPTTSGRYNSRLGLSVAQATALAYGGRIEYQNGLASNTFIVRLPVSGSI